MKELFCKQEIYNVLENQRKEIESELKSIPDNQLLNSSTIDLAEYFFKKYSLNVPILDKENAVLSDGKAKIRNRFYSGSQYDYEFFDGICYILEIPFSGDSNFFDIRPSEFRLSFPRADVQSNLVRITVECTKNDAQNHTQIKKDFEEQIEEITYFLGNLQKDVISYNSKIEKNISEKIERRKKEILDVKNTMANLGFKLKSSNQPKTYSVPITQKKIQISRPTSSSEPYKPEPILKEDDYNSILEVLDNMASVLERSPSAFATMQEEDLRCHFLVQLNGQFDGQATGETFNKNGKTDILIQVDGKSIFIAECKFWKGEKKYLETIDQILGYLTWRDTKAAILIFNKNKELSKVLETIKDVTQKHSNFKKYQGQKSETDFRYVFANNEDRNREIYLAIKVFDIPTN